MLSLLLSAVLCSNVTTPFTGTLCTPNDGKKHAAVILLSGSEGGNSMKGFARMFAEHGYVGVSVAYFKMPGLPQKLVDIPVETIEPAIDALQARPDVDRGELGILGPSKGGEFSLLAASTYPQIKAVVAIVPSPIAYMGLNETDQPENCSWTKAGKELPCVAADPSAGMAIGQEFAAQKPITLKPLYDASRNADSTVTRKATFPLERINGPVLCLAGQDDQMWNSPAHCDIAMRYLKAHHHRFADREIVYPNAGHMFFMALSGPSSAMNTYAFPGGSFAFGGTPQADADAATASWQAIWDFLQKTLAP